VSAELRGSTRGEPQSAAGSTQGRSRGARGRSERRGPSTGTAPERGRRVSSGSKNGMPTCRHPSKRRPPWTGHSPAVPIHSEPRAPDDERDPGDAADDQQRGLSRRTGAGSTRLAWRRLSSIGEGARLIMGWPPSSRIHVGADEEVDEAAAALAQLLGAAGGLLPAEDRERVSGCADGEEPWISSQRWRPADRRRRCSASGRRARGLASHGAAGAGSRGRRVHQRRESTRCAARRVGRHLLDALACGVGDEDHRDNIGRRRPTRSTRANKG